MHTWTLLNLGEQVPLGVMRELHQMGRARNGYNCLVTHVTCVSNGQLQTTTRVQLDHWCYPACVDSCCLVLPDILLPWDQLAIWAITVGSNMARATPFLGHEGPGASLLKIGDLAMVHAGDDARFALLGGRFVGAGALLRFYVLHCVAIPVVASVLMAVHFWRVRKDGGISGPM